MYKTTHFWVAVAEAETELALQIQIFTPNRQTLLKVIKMPRGMLENIQRSMNKIYFLTLNRT